MSWENWREGMGMGEGWQGRGLSNIGVPTSGPSGNLEALWNPQHAYLRQYIASLESTAGQLRIAESDFKKRADEAQKERERAALNKAAKEGWASSTAMSRAREEISKDIENQKAAFDARIRMEELNLGRRRAEAQGLAKVAGMAPWRDLLGLGAQVGGAALGSALGPGGALAGGILGGKVKDALSGAGGFDYGEQGGVPGGEGSGVTIVSAPEESDDVPGGEAYGGVQPIDPRSALSFPQALGGGLKPTPQTESRYQENISGRMGVGMGMWPDATAQDMSSHRMGGPMRLGMPPDPAAEMAARDNRIRRHLGVGQTSWRPQSRMV
jgi:hypothetical protein